MRKKLYFADKEQILKDPIEYWMGVIQEDIHLFDNFDSVKHRIEKLRDADLLRYFTIKNTGIFAYIITDDFTGGRSLLELMFYIRKGNRGSIRLVIEYIKMAEQIAFDTNCDSVKIGSNSGYNDAAFLKLLKRLDYVDDTLSKRIRRKLA